MPIDHMREIAKIHIQSAVAMLVAAGAKNLDPSDTKIVPVAMKKLATVARSLSGTSPIGDDAAAAKLSAVAASLMYCNNRELKRDVSSEVTKAAKIFDALAQRV
jgi:hypothetical protein